VLQELPNNIGAMALGESLVQTPYFTHEKMRYGEGKKPGIATAVT
jgi:hypothetical protein